MSADEATSEEEDSTDDLSVSVSGSQSSSELSHDADPGELVLSSSSGSDDEADAITAEAEAEAAAAAEEEKKVDDVEVAIAHAKRLADAPAYGSLQALVGSPSPESPSHRARRKSFSAPSISPTSPAPTGAATSTDGGDGRKASVRMRRQASAVLPGLDADSNPFVMPSEAGASEDAVQKLAAKQHIMSATPVPEHLRPVERATSRPVVWRFVFSEHRIPFFIFAYTTWGIFINALRFLAPPIRRTGRTRRRCGSAGSSGSPSRAARCCGPRAPASATTTGWAAGAGPSPPSPPTKRAAVAAPAPAPPGPGPAPATAATATNGRPVAAASAATA